MNTTHPSASGVATPRPRPPLVRPSIATAWQDWAQARLALMGIEWRQRRWLLLQQMVLGLMTTAFFSLACLFAALGVMVYFWDTHRLQAAYGLTALFGLLGLLALGSLLRCAHLARDSFATTKREFELDSQALRHALQPPEASS